MIQFLVHEQADNVGVATVDIKSGETASGLYMDSQKKIKVKALQDKMAKMQEELALKKVEASAGGGMVTAVVNGKFELMAIRIEKDVVNPDDVDMLQDLIVAAVNEGVRKAQEMASAEMAKVTGGMKLPGMM